LLGRPNTLEDARKVFVVSFRAWVIFNGNKIGELDLQGIEAGNFPKDRKPTHRYARYLEQAR
jgi:hypothetical protein